MAPPSRLADEIINVAKEVDEKFAAEKRVLSFDEYLELFSKDPVNQARDAARYLLGAFDHYGKRVISYPWGDYNRYNLFDLPWEHNDRRHGLSRGGLVGQEAVQEEVYRALSNFVREGRPNRLLLLHGPNGSAKSTLVACIMRALENYSTLAEGALYRYAWVFPSSKTVRGTLGFDRAKNDGPRIDSYAHLTDDLLDAKIIVEVRDHPLFLVPVPERRKILVQCLGEEATSALPTWILNGELCHKSQQIFEALLSGHKGSYIEVLKHVQVERFYISQRYRVGAVTVGPQMSIDAAERQVTMDRSFSALPASLQALSLFEAKGELIDAASGLLEFSDLLKRPLDAFKYLQLTIETGEVSLSQQTVSLNSVLMGSANELHLDAFREHPEFPSFRGRLELIRTPYLRSYLQEKMLYDSQVVGQVRRHIAPHATTMAAMFAVLTRMRKPNPDRFPRQLAAAVSGLTALEKLDLYATGQAPERLESDLKKVLEADVEQVFAESDSYPIYEGRVGASPREMRILLLDAAQSDSYKCLSPLAVFEELDELCQSKGEFEWLQQEITAGGYHDTKLFREELVDRLLSIWEQEFYLASGIVDQQQYDDLFDRYVQHVSVWVKRERIRNRVTGEYEEPDEKMMREVERLLDVKQETSDYRKQLISTIAAWSLDNNGEKIEAWRVFPQSLKKVKEAIFIDKRGHVGQLLKSVVVLTREEGTGLNAEQRGDARGVVDRLIEKQGYCENCASDMASVLFRRRFPDS